MMESNISLTISNPIGGTSCQNTAASTYTTNTSNQVFLQTTSSEVISNLITSLSSMPAVSSHLNERPVFSPPVSPLTGPNSTPPSSSSGQNNSRTPSYGSFGVDYGTSSKHSSTRISTLDQSYDKLATPLPAVQAAKLFPVRSECSSKFSTTETSPCDSTNTANLLNTKLHSESRDLNTTERRSIGNPRVEPYRDLVDSGRKFSDGWGKKERRIHYIAVGTPRDKEKDRKKYPVSLSEKRHNPSRPSIDPSPLGNEILKNTELDLAHSSQQTGDSNLSIPVRESSLPRSGESSRRSSIRRNPRTSVDGTSSTSGESRKVHMKQSTWDSVSEQSQKDDDFLTGFSYSPSDEIAPSFVARKSIDRDSRQKNRLSSQTSNHRTYLNSRSHTTDQINLDDRPSSVGSIDEAVGAYLCAPRLSQKIKHPLTGRVTSFSEVGDSEGFAVFCCVGMGLTRYVTALYDELASTLKLRLITPDRPGVGDSEPYNDGTATPLGWPDDVYAICQSLKITKFSLLAHSAGAIYALATALRMPQHIRGRIHLLAPWIPPSQMNVIGGHVGLPPNSSIPTSQRILRVLPTPFLRAANSSFINATSNSLTSSLPKQRKAKRRSISNSVLAGIEKDNIQRNSLQYFDPSEILINHPDEAHLRSEATILAAAANSLAVKERQVTYQSRLTHAIWNLATQGANPAVDLLVCLERRHTVGFRYVDITRAVVIHHGSKDARVPVENVLWMGKTMKRCEVRVLEGEGHSLMGSASIMSSILTEISKEWEDWIRVTTSTVGHRNEVNRRTLRERASHYGSI